MRVDYICETCGKKGVRYYPKGKAPGHFFCSVPCQNEWQKTREDIVIKNKDPQFRKKVSEGLKKRKERLGDNYHSKEAKEKIGRATIQRWNSVKYKVLPVLRKNAEKRKIHLDNPYNFAWQNLSKKLRSERVCSRCSSDKDLVLHHIIPASKGGKSHKDNAVVLCNHCHPIVEKQQRIIFGIVQDWEIAALLVKERLGSVEKSGSKKCQTI